MSRASRTIVPTRRAVLQGGSALAAAVAFPSALDAQPRTTVNDASRLSRTTVALHLHLRTDDQAAFVAKLRSELKSAAVAKRPFAVAVARHTMGGQSIPRDGTAVTMSDGLCDINRDSMTFRATAGTTWRQVIATLDKAGFSPAVMQSNNDFGVGSTFCVNAHGWPVSYGPFGSTVRAISMMMADGSILRCTPAVNAELFNLAMGGYGLFGVVLDVEAAMVPNLLLAPTYQTMPTTDFARSFLTALGDEHVKMAYGRLSVAKDVFFDDALMCTYRPLPTPAEGLPPAAHENAFTGVSRRIYRAQTGWEFTKRFRWLMETKIGPMNSSIATRNTLMNEPVANLANDDDTRTDILHEYFVAPEKFNDFVAACRDIVPKSGLEFLNVTLRYVKPDTQSVLTYAPQQRIAAVMSFSQPATSAGEREMRTITEALIDRVTAIRGTFYLPYRLHARRDQLRTAYPRFDEFVDRKKHYDPGLLFRNVMWDTYAAN